jgi:hypothetical protein
VPLRTWFGGRRSSCAALYVGKLFVVLAFVSRVPKLSSVALRSQNAVLLGASLSIAWLAASVKFFLRGLGAVRKNSIQLRSRNPLATTSYQLSSLAIGGPMYNHRVELTRGVASWRCAVTFVARAVHAKRWASE